MPRLFLSPATVLEIQFLVEIGRVKLREGHALDEIAAHCRWRLDEPPAGRWFTQAAAFGWTRNPFDRLLAAHGRIRGWKLATADGLLLERLPAADVLPL